MNRFFALVAFAAFLFASVPLSAADVAGTWKGVIEISHDGAAPVSTPIQLRLERQGPDLTGDIGREAQDEHIPIRHGRVEGGMVYFEASSDHTKSPMQFRLTLTGDRLEGEMSGEVEQGKITGQVRLSREEH